jgi:hypothetical protein
MKTIFKSFPITFAFVLFAAIGLAQASGVQPDYLDVHINQSTSRTALGELQKEMNDYNIGFRYDLVQWENDQLLSIRFAVRLPDGTMRRNNYETIDAETDIWIRLEGNGAERIFCAGSACE